MTYANVQPDSWKLKFWNGGTWIDITSDCIQAPFIVGWGMADNRPETMMASAGQLTFTLDNSLGYYLPEIGSPIVGWGKATPVRLTITYDGVDYIRFRGRVDGLTPHNEVQAALTVDVTCLDWVDFAVKYPLQAPQVTYGITADAAITDIIATFPAALQPQAQALDVGTAAFPSLFDAVSEKTTAYEEFNKLALSEMGYCYLQHDKVNGETLVFENNTHRNGLNPLSNVPKTKAGCGFLLKNGSGSDHILLNGSGTDKLIPNLVDSASLNNLASAVDETYAENIINRLTINTYPKTVGASPVVLFSLGTDKPIKIASGAARVHHYTFHNPVGGKAISGVGLINPVATTDFLFNTKADGSGTDITAYLTLSCTFSSPKATITLTNTYTQVGYITWMQIRGLPIYQDDSLTAILENSTSEQIYGYQDLIIEQVYQQDTDTGERIGAGILEANKAPHVRVNSITFDANISTFAMQMFLNTDVGSLVQVIDAQYAVNDWFYIQGVSFSLGLTGKISVKWIVKKASSIASGALSPVGVEFHVATNEAINFGELPLLDSLSFFGFSFWMYSDQLGGGYIASYENGWTGWNISFDTSGHAITLNNYQWNGGSVSFNVACTINQSTLTHVIITGNMAGMSMLSAFINSVSKGVGASPSLPSGDYLPITGNNFVLGNVLYSAGIYVQPFCGYIKDFRAYNRILIPADATTLYNGGTPSATVGPLDHLIFQGPCVRMKELANYVGHTLTVDLPVLDNVFGVVGVPNGSPAGIAF